MAIGDDPVKTNLMQIGSLQLEHLKDSIPVDLIRSFLNLSILDGRAPELGLDQPLTEFIEQIECWQVSTTRDLDQLGEAVSNLSLGQGSQESKIKKRVHGCMVGTESVLVVAVVHSYLDADAGVNQADDGCWDANVVRVATISGTGKSVKMLDVPSRCEVMG